MDEADVMAAVVFGGYAALVTLAFLIRAFYLLYLWAKRQKERKAVEEDEGKMTEGAYAEREEERDLLESIFRSRMTYRKAFEAFFYRSKYTVVWTVFQVMVTFASCYAFIQVTYDYPYVSADWIGAECFFTVVFSLDFVLSFLAAPAKAWYLLHPYPFIDWMTCFPFWISWGYGNPYSYTDASGDMLNGVLFFRTLRIFRSVRMVDMHKLVPLRNDRDYLRAEILRACAVLAVLFFICICSMQYTESKTTGCAFVIPPNSHPLHFFLFSISSLSIVVLSYVLLY